MSPDVISFRHEPSGTFSYVVRDPASKAAAIVDPVLDYDGASARTGSESAGRLTDYVEGHGLDVQWILETHAHADHLSAAPVVQSRVGGRIAIGAGIRTVQERFRGIFNLKDLNVTGTQFDHLFENGETFRIGDLQGEVIPTPGHTSDSVSYLVGDAVFVGDTLFAPDKGTARADFPGGSARELFASTRRLLQLPGNTRVFLCHDYPPSGRDPEFVHTVSEHRQHNVHVRDGIDAGQFVEKREARDKTLGMPDLIVPSVQVNISAGQLPEPEDNGVSYLKVPLNVLGGDRSHG